MKLWNCVDDFVGDIPQKMFKVSTIASDACVTPTDHGLVDSLKYIWILLYTQHQRRFLQPDPFGIHSRDLGLTRGGFRAGQTGPLPGAAFSIFVRGGKTARASPGLKSEEWTVRELNRRHSNQHGTDQYAQKEQGAIEEE
ncbi:hypothetical protein TNCV_4786011 [Trichonephila clavipes]|nr:hypothetical protein TNCV_4786011 [Trichonephila clavipes]